MAIGIDKGAHKRLMDGLGKLAAENGDASDWKSLETELDDTYRTMMETVKLAKQNALRYKKCFESIRNKTSLELRKSRKT